MSTLAPAASAADRHRLFAALATRNRIVAILRLGLPALGLLVFAGLMLQLVIASLVPDLGFADISIDRDRLVVDAPGYAAMSADGTSYEVNAAQAAAVIGRTDLVDLSDVLLTVRKPTGAVMTAAAAAAQFQTTDQIVSVDGVTRVADDAGTHGTLNGVRADIPAESMTAAGAVDITFANGATLEASGMSYSSDGVWRFSAATVVLPSTPGEDLPPAEETP